MGIEEKMMLEALPQLNECREGASDTRSVPASVAFNVSAEALKAFNAPDVWQPVADD